MIRAASLRGFVPLVQELGGDPDELLREFGMSREVVASDDALVPITAHDHVLDVAAGRKEGYVTVDHPVTPRELDETAARAGVRVQPGDAVVIRSGDEAFREAHPDWVPRVSPHPGLHVSCLEWFRERDIAAVAWT